MSRAFGLKSAAACRFAGYQLPAAGLIYFDKTSEARASWRQRTEPMPVSAKRHFRPDLRSSSADPWWRH